MASSASEQLHATFLDLVKTIDPYPHPAEPLIHPRDGQRMTPFHLVLDDYHCRPPQLPILPIGHIHPIILADMLAFNLEENGKGFAFYPVRGPREGDVVLGAVKAVAFHDGAVQKGKEGLTGIVDDFVEFMRKKGTIPEDRFGPNEDRLALYASPFSAVFKGEPLQPYANAIATVARSRSGFFGSATFGVAAITVYEGRGKDMKVWIQKRGGNMSHWAGQYDVTAGGALCAGMTPLEGTVQECVEEAELPAEFCTQHLKPKSMASYWMSAKEWVRPHNTYTFELQITDGMPRPKIPAWLPGATHTEVDGYNVLTPTEIIEALLQGRFQPHAAIKMIDFLDRHGLIEGDQGIEEIRWRVQREQAVAKPEGVEAFGSELEGSV